MLHIIPTCFLSVRFSRKELKKEKVYELLPIFPYIEIHSICNKKKVRSGDIEKKVSNLFMVKDFEKLLLLSQVVLFRNPNEEDGLWRIL